MNPSRLVFSAWLVSCGFAAAAITDNFDTYPGGGSGWAGNWTDSDGTSNVDATVTNTSQLNGGGSYLSVSSTVAAANTGVTRNIGAASASPYTLSFDWRLDSADSTFSVYDDRIHIGASTAAEYGTNANWTWMVGVVGGDNGGTLYDDKRWYFYDNTSTSTSGAFTSANMRVSSITLTTGVTYSFIITVNPATQKYDAFMTDGTNTFSQTGMDFRNQGSDTGNASNLVFGGASSAANELAYSVDSINIVVPEPSSALLLGAAGLLCLKRRRIAG